MSVRRNVFFIAFFFLVSLISLLGSTLLGSALGDTKKKNLLFLFQLKIVGPYLVVLAVAVDHPVLAIGADLQFEAGDIIGPVCRFRNGSLGGNAGQNLKEVQVHLMRK